MESTVKEKLTEQIPIRESSSCDLDQGSAASLIENGSMIWKPSAQGGLATWFNLNPD